MSLTENGRLLSDFVVRSVREGETPTEGYNLLRAEVSHTRTLQNHPSGIRQFTVGVVGNNLLNENIRNHVSYTKDFVLMPGAGVRAFASVKY